ncbi:MAG TPA: TIGR03435 family protein [Terracidiphilus sp.]|nr:TIGR03435 family protein [Terracidiphilus sp.]
MGLALAACLGLLGPCAIAQVGAATPQAANPAPPSSPAAPASTPAIADSVALPAWDVSTIKPSSPDARASMFMITPDGIKFTNVPLWSIVREAFGLTNERLFGGPSWAKTTPFDIEAKVAPEDAPRLKTLTPEQRRQMIVALLEERFGLKFHHESRNLPMYELVVAKGGVKMQASKLDEPEGQGPDSVPGNGPRPDPAPARHMLMMHGRGHIESTGSAIALLASLLSGQLGRTVVDKTELRGNYDYKLDWTPDDAAPVMLKSSNPTPGDNSLSQDTGGPSLFTALEEQLGLKLESTKGPVDVIVIDHMEQATAN